MHSTWPSGNAMARRIEGPEFHYGHYLFFFFSSSFLFSFCLVFLLVIAVLFLYIALVFLYLQIFFRIAYFPFQLLAVSPKSFARSCDSRISSKSCVKSKAPRSELMDELN